MKNSDMVKKGYNKFIKNICSTEVVYGLTDTDGGFATSHSMSYEYDDGEPVGIICFWSEKALATYCISEEWSNYSITEVPLGPFLENWCIGMDNDEFLVGTDFDQELYGFEAEPLDLILDIAAELKLQGKDVELKKFNSIDDLESQVHELVESFEE